MSRAAFSQDENNDTGSILKTPVFFLHVPKTAGTSVRHFLEASLHPHEFRRIFDVDGEVLARSFDPLPPCVRFVSGHLPFWYRDAFSTRARTLLFLRNPVARALSTYRYWKGLPTPPDSDQSGEAKLLRAAQSVTIEEFANNTNGIWWGAISNYATRLVGHPRPWDMRVRFDLGFPRLAQYRIESIEMLGVSERLDDSMTLIAHELGVPFTRSLPALNVSAANHGTDLAPQSVIRALTEASGYDLALWENANAEVDRRLTSVARAGRTRCGRFASASDARFYPRADGDCLVLHLGKDPVLCEGWLPPEDDAFQSWRFAAAPGPAHIHAQWPAHTDDLALVIESPFAAPGFDYAQLEIKVDDQPVVCRVMHLQDRAWIVTKAIPPATSYARVLTFSYPDPNEYRAGERVKGSHERIAFAVTWIKWAPCPGGDWDALGRVDERLSSEVQALRTLAETHSSALRDLEQMIAEKDAYSASLSQAIAQKDEYARTLEVRLNELTRQKSATAQLA